MVRESQRSRKPPKENRRGRGPPRLAHAAEGRQESQQGRRHTPGSPKRKDQRPQSPPGATSMVAPGGFVGVVEAVAFVCVAELGAVLAGVVAAAVGVRVADVVPGIVICL